MKISWLPATRHLDSVGIAHSWQRAEEGVKGINTPDGCQPSRVGGEVLLMTALTIAASLPLPSIGGKMTCAECLIRMYPEDPRQPFLLKGKYLPPLCEPCPNYIREEIKEPEPFTTPTVARLFKKLELLESTLTHQRNKWNEHMDRKTKKYSTYDEPTANTANEQA